MPESGGTVKHQESPLPEGVSSARGVFLSYASQDTAIANSVIDALTLAKLEENHANDGATGIALICANRGEVDQAFKWLDRAYRQHQAALGQIKVNPLLKNIQSDPRFNALLRNLGLQD
jgi:hypothetical protein